MTTIRKTRGDDIDAACGQLAGEVRDRTARRTSAWWCARRWRRHGAAQPDPRSAAAGARRWAGPCTWPSFWRLASGWRLRQPNEVTTPAGARSANCPPPAHRGSRSRPARAHPAGAGRGLTSPQPDRHGAGRNSSALAAIPTFAGLQPARPDLRGSAQRHDAAESSFRARSLNPRDADALQNYWLVPVPAGPATRPGTRTRFAQALAAAAAIGLRLLAARACARRAGRGPAGLRAPTTMDPATRSTAGQPGRSAAAPRRLD